MTFIWDGRLVPNRDIAATVYICISAFLGLVYGVYNALQVTKIPIEDKSYHEPMLELRRTYDPEAQAKKQKKEMAKKAKASAAPAPAVTGAAAPKGMPLESTSTSSSSNSSDSSDSSSTGSSYSSFTSYSYTDEVVFLDDGGAALDDGGMNTFSATSSSSTDGSSSSSSKDYNPKEVLAKVTEINKAIKEGAMAFLYAEYRILFAFLIFFSVILFVILGVAGAPVQAKGGKWVSAIFSVIAYLTGGITSITCGYIGMRIAVVANAKVAVMAVKGIPPAFAVAYRSGSVLGFCLVGLAITTLFIIIHTFNLHFELRTNLYSAVSAFGLGGSTVALFGRVGGGIFTKAADVGSDIVGKVEQGIPEDDPRNPAVIADCVGDNVGDIAGMSADLFGSFASATCSSLVIASKTPMLAETWSGTVFPIIIMSTGIWVSFFTSFIAYLAPPKDIKSIEPALKRQILVSTIIMTPALALIAWIFLPARFEITFSDGVIHVVKWWHVYIASLTGLYTGMIVGYMTEFFTSNSFSPVRKVAESARTGTATLIIYGLALGYLSVIVPVVCLCFTIYISERLAGFYGIAIAALGILSTLPVSLTIDAYGPVSDNAGGIAEMAGMGPEIRDQTDALDAAGNTTAAVGKGFAITSAALVALALISAFVSVSKGITAGMPTSVNILNPFATLGLLYGAMLPYWFSAMTMKSVGQAAMAMVEEVRRQFREKKGIMKGTEKPDYRRCVKISTDAALKEMVLPGLLVLITPLWVGFILGVDCLCGVLVGALVSAVQLAVSMANTGGAWDNSKKYVEGGALGGKNSDIHKSTVVGDTVGDPLKDTSGPALNILMKIMAILSVVFAPAFRTRGGQLERVID